MFAGVTTSSASQLAQVAASTSRTETYTIVCRTVLSAPTSMNQKSWRGTVAFHAGGRASRPEGLDMTERFRTPMVTAVVSTSLTAHVNDVDMVIRVTLCHRMVAV
ncbi:hypothetical protein Asi03nite_19030 [Actinoplanes siamensis]|uniref:Uncharacterized protein n=1 Tax=Actinoplanes siamensis TaxID=1223317 RepID=A0A919N4S1_9ACTN|nr:hypothetical protein Asi03nite_19030 [Actinoplanes siamensis]